MQNMYENYFENEILAADPVKLVQLLYRGALEAVSTARAAVRSGDIGTRSRNITKAACILHELALSLDHSKGPAISRPLVELYDYMQRLLIDANFQQIEQPLIEVEQLLTGLEEAWQAIRAPEASPIPVSDPYAGAFVPEYDRLDCSY